MGCNSSIKGSILDLPPPFPTQEKQYEGSNGRVIRLVQQTFPDALNLSEGEFLRFSEGPYGKGLYFSKADTCPDNNTPFKKLTIDAFVALGRSLVRSKECRGMDYDALVNGHKCASVKGERRECKTEYVVYHKDQVYIREVRFAGGVLWTSGET